MPETKKEIKEEVLDAKSMSVKERIVRISNELKVTKDGKNTFADFEYIKPEGLLNALKPLLLKYRLFMYVNMRELDSEGKRNECVLMLEDFDTDVGRKIYTMKADTIPISKGNPVQAKQSVKTYLIRYLLMAAFCIAEDTDDLDSDEMTEKVNKASKEKPSKGQENKEKTPEQEASEKLVLLCKEKAKVNKPKVLEILLKYDKVKGSVYNIKALDEINNATIEIQNIKEEKGE